MGYDLVWWCLISSIIAFGIAAVIEQCTEGSGFASFMLSLLSTLILVALTVGHHL